MDGRVALRAVVATVLVAASVSHADASASAYPSTPLEHFGAPTEGYQATDTQSVCYGYQVASRTTPIKMGGTRYLQGFQLSTLGVCRGTWTWTWHLAGRYAGFSACVGLAGGDTRPASLSFLGPKGTPMSFQADGVQVRTTTLVAGLPSFVTLGTTHLMNLVIRTSTTGATIGFGDDGLYWEDIPDRECG